MAGKAGFRRDSKHRVLRRGDFSHTNGQEIGKWADNYKDEK